MDITQFQELIKLFGLDIGLYALAAVLSLGLRFARAYWRIVDDPHTLLAAVIMGLGGAGLVLTIDHRPWQVIVVQGLTLSAVTLLGERFLRSQAGKYGLPADNEWADDNITTGGTK